MAPFIAFRTLLFFDHTLGVPSDNVHCVVIADLLTVEKSWEGRFNGISLSKETKVETLVGVLERQMAGTGRTPTVPYEVD